MYVGRPRSGPLRCFGAPPAAAQAAGVQHEIRERLMQEMARTGLEVTTRAEVARVEKVRAAARARAGAALVLTLARGRASWGGMQSEDGALTLQLKDGRELGPYDAVIAAIGRQPNTASLNVEAAGVVLKESGHVEVDDWHQTSVPGVYAVGDVIGELDLTPTAIAAGRLLGTRPARGGHMCHGCGEPSRCVHSRSRSPVPGQVAANAVRQCAHRDLQPPAHRHGGVVRGRRAGGVRRRCGEGVPQVRRVCGQCGVCAGSCGVCAGGGRR